MGEETHSIEHLFTSQQRFSHTIQRATLIYLFSFLPSQIITNPTKFLFLTPSSHYMSSIVYFTEEIKEVKDQSASLNPATGKKKEKKVVPQAPTAIKPSD